MKKTILKDKIGTVYDYIKKRLSYAQFRINPMFCDIPNIHKIPRSTIFVHKGLGVIIAKATKIGKNVKIYQFVTLGGRGTGSRSGSPKIGNNVIIYAHSSILGGVTIGDNSIIGAYSLVIHDVKPGTVVYGIPAVEKKYIEEKI